MWKRFLVVLISLVGTFSVVYALNTELFATTNTSVASTNVYETKPYNMNMNDTVWWSNASFNRTDPVEWRVIANGFNNNKAPKNYLTLQTAYSQFGTTVGKSVDNTDKGEDLKHGYYGKTKIHQQINERFNWTTLDKEKNYIIPMKVYDTNGEAIPYASSTEGTVLAYPLSLQEAYVSGVDEKGGLIRGVYTVSTPNYYFPNQTTRDVTISTDNVYVRTRSLNPANPDNGVAALLNSGLLADSFAGDATFYAMPIMQLNQSSFALATPLSDSTGVVANGKLTISPSVRTQMKIALKHANAKVSITNTDAIPKVSETTHNYKIDYNLTGGSTGAGKYINAVLSTVDTATGIETSTLIGRVSSVSSLGNGSVDLDFSNAAPGKYVLRLYYEEVNSGVTNYNVASSVSNGIDIEIVTPREITYTEKPASGASIANTYEYSKNVKGGTKVGELNFQNGVGTPELSIIASPNAPVASKDDYLNFEVNTAPTSSPVGVNIKANAPKLVDDYLKAGTYYFRIVAMDTNGDETYTDVTMKVEKTAVKDFSFNTNTQTDIAIGTTVKSEAISTSNTDLSSTVLPTYSLSSNKSNAISVSASGATTYNITPLASYTGSNLPETITLSAYIKETDNFKASSTITKTFRVYKTLNSLSFTPYKSSFNAADTVAGYAIGSVSAKDGFPTSYVYALTSSADGSSYVASEAIDNSKVEIKKNTTSGKYEVLLKENLGAGTYKFQFKLNDGKDTSYKSVTFTIVKSDQASLNFVDSANKVITGAEFTYSAQNAFVKAIGGSGSATVHYALSDTQPPETGDHASNLLAVEPTTGKLTFKGIGKVNITATKSGGAGYNDATTTITVTILNGPQTIKFVADPKEHNLSDGSSLTLKATIDGREDNTASKAKVTYVSNTPEVCTISTDGVVEFSTTGECSLTASNSDKNYEPVTDNIKIQVYGALNADIVMDKDTQAEVSKSGAKVAVITPSGGKAPYSYMLDTKLSSLLQISNGTLSLNKNLKRTDITSLYVSSEKKYVLKGTATVTDALGKTLPVEVIVNFLGAPLNASFNDAVNGVITKKYSLDGSFNVTLKDNSGNGDVTFTKKEDVDSLLGNVETNGEIQIAKSGTTPAKIQAVIIPSDGYNGQTLEASIVIDPGSQSIAFNDDTPTKKLVSDKYFTVGATVTRSDGSTPGAIDYTSKTLDICTIDSSSGKVTIESETGGKCTLTASNSDANYASVTTSPYDIMIYGDMAANFKQYDALNPVPVGTTKDTAIGGITDIVGGDKNYTFELTNASDLFAINPTTGIIQLARELEADDLKGKWTKEDGYAISFNVLVKDNSGNSTAVTVKVMCKGAAITPKFEGASDDGILHKPYVQGGSVELKIIGNTGTGAITYSRTDTEGLLSDFTNGTGVIAKASDSEYATITASIAPNNGYEAATTSLKLYIDKATQTVAFDASVKDKIAFKQDDIFTVSANSTPTGADITYEASPSSTCTISNSTVTMKDKGTCTIKATATRANYADKSVTKDITFYQGLDGEFIQRKTDLEAIGNDETPKIGPIFVGDFDASGGASGNLEYYLSTDVDDENAASSLFSVSKEDGDVSLLQDVKAEQLEQLATYDTTKSVYLLKIKVDVIDGSDTKSIPCEIEIKGAPLKNLSFDKDTKNIITKTYTNDTNQKYFNIEATGNDGSGAITYSLKSGSDIPDGIIQLSGTGNKKVEILNADEKYAIVIADITQSKGYAKTQTEVKVKVNKAQLTDFNFKDTNPTWMMKESQETPEFEHYPSGSTIKLESSKPTVISINGNSLKAEADGKDITISATTPLDTDTVLYRNYEQKTVTKTYHVYTSLGGKINITAKNMQADTETAKKGKVIGTLGVSNGQGPISKTITKGMNYFNVSDSGILTLKEQITKDDLTWDATKKVYYIPLEITLQDDTLKPVVLQTNVEFIGAPLNELLFKDATNDVISQPYEAAGQYQLELRTIDDAPFTGGVTYRLKNGADDTGVVAGIDADGLVYMGEASEGLGDVIIEAVVDPQNGYTGTTLECIFEITQIEQDFDFTEKNIDLSLSDPTPHKIEFTKTPIKGTPDLKLNPETGIAKITTVNKKSSITPVGKGKATLTATDAGNRNYKSRTVTTEVTVYDGASVNLTLGAMPQAETDSANAGNTVGTYTTSGGLNDVKVTIDEVAFDGNKYFKIVNDTDVVAFNQNITASILKDYPYDVDKQAYVMQVVFTLTDDTGIPVKSSPQNVYVKGAPIKNVSFINGEGNAISEFEKTYDATGQPFAVELSGKVGNAWPYGTVTYGLNIVNSPEADGSSTIITNINPTNGTILMKNANLLSGPGSDEETHVTASIAPAKGYAGTETPIDCELRILQAEQGEFKIRPITLMVGGTANPVYDKKLTSNGVDIDIVGTGIASYDKVTDMITALKAGTATINATALSDRNYKSKASSTTVTVTNANNYDLILKGIDPVTYGDVGADGKSTVQAEFFRNEAIGKNKTQVWTSSNENVATVDNTGLITFHNAGNTSIQVKQTTEVEDEVTSQPIPFTVNRRSITVQVSDKQKYVGEAMPTFTIEKPITGVLEKDKDDFKDPILYICQDDDGNYVNELTKAGKYKIEAIFDSKANSNYTLGKDNENLKVGTLTVSQDPSEATWYKIRSDAQPTDKGWYNKDVFLDLVESPDRVYDKISDKIDGTYDKSIPVKEEGVNDKDIYFKESTSNKIAAPQEATVKVDQTKPQITTVTGKTINDNTFARVMNTLTLNAFYKPGSEITISAIDNAPQANVESSGVAKIDYKVEREVADENGNTLIKEGSEESNQATFTINELGEYNICAIATDNAGNQSPQTCQKATISKIDVDVDGDGKPDFNDPNGDGCPDLNIKWKDPSDPNKWIVINGDRDYDGIPDLNVDSDGDGKPNLNIDTDGDNLPDINLVILKKGDWTAGTCIVGEVEEYSGGTTSVKPQINIDTGNDQIPDINIDTNGDMKADYNITKSGETKPYMNMGPIHAEWLPKKDCKSANFVYDTDNTFKPLLNIDSDGDGLPDINLDFDDDGNPDLNIDLDFDNIPDVDIDGDGDGKPDINLDPDKTGSPTENIIDIKEWKPNHNVDGDFPYDTMIIGMKDSLEDNDIVIEKPNGGKFPSYYSLKVRNITSEISDSDRLVMQAFLSSDTEIKEIFDVKLYANGVQIDPNETIRVRIPLNASYRAAETLKLIVEQKDSTFVETPFERGEDYLTYETDFLGKVGIIADINETSSKPTQPDEDISNKDKDEESNRSVSGAYTGDETNAFGSFIVGIGALVVLCYQLRRKKHNS